MSNSHKVLKAIEYAFGGSILTSVGVLLVAAWAFGFQFTQWAEWQGRMVGIVSVIGGVAGAVVGELSHTFLGNLAHLKSLY
jgi:hypothetical protein